MPRSKQRLAVLFATAALSATACSPTLEVSTAEAPAQLPSPSAAEPTGNPQTPQTGVSSAFPELDLDPFQRPGDARDREPDQPPITLSFAGDVHFADHVSWLLDNDGLDVSKKALSRADLTFVNLETAITNGGVSEPKTFTFRAPERALTVLADLGVDGVSLANNHAVDFGGTGLADTLAAKKSGPLPMFGIGKNLAEAAAPAEFEVRGTKVAVIGATQVMDRTATVWSATDDSPGVLAAGDPTALTKSVEEADQINDVVVVFLHWGQEMQRCPTWTQRELAEQLSAAGADIIVGAHAHMLQGHGWLGESYVSYGLGNYIWYSQRNAETVSTGVLTVEIADGQPSKAKFAPAVIQGNGAPLPRTGYSRKVEIERVKGLRNCAGLSAKPVPPIE